MTALWTDACFLVENSSSVTCAPLLVGHAIRELESLLFAIFAAGVESKSGREAEACPSRSPNGSPEKERKKRIDEAAGILGIGEDDPLIRAWKDLQPHKIAHRNGLQAPPVDDEFLEAFEAFTDVLEAVAIRWERAFSGWLHQLDRLRHVDAPTKPDAEELMQRIPHNLVTLSHFFDGLSNPKWVRMRKLRSLFDTPPDVEYVDSGRSVRYWPWPQGDYLARTAPVEPEKVASIIRRWTMVQNPLVLADLARIGSAIAHASPGLSGEVADITERRIQDIPSWIRKDELRPFYTLIGDLLSQEFRRSLSLARALLAVLPDPNPEESFESRTLRFPIARVGSDNYTAAVDGVLHSLRSIPREEALALCCDLLESAAALSPPLAADHETIDAQAYTSDDASTNWRESIGSGRPHRRDPRDALVDAVVRVAGEVMKQDTSSRRTALEHLAGRRWAIFRRIALHLVAEYEDPSLSTEWLCNRDHLDDEATVREYVALAERRFGDIPGDAQRQILEWIEAGPERTAPMSILGSLDKAPEARRTEILRRWRLQRLHAIKKALPPPWVQRYESWAGLGPWPDPQARTEFRVSTVDPVSPVDPVELRSMSIENIVEFCRSWVPDDASIFAPSERGLASALVQTVEEDPRRFAAHASAFEEVFPARYVSALIVGLRNSLRAPSLDAPDWEPVFEMIASVVNRLQAEGDGSESGLDDDSTPARRNVAEFMTLAFGPAWDDEDGRTKRILDISSRAWEHVLQALRALSEDADPNPSLISMLHERRVHYDLAIDHPGVLTTRALALDAIIRVATWLRRHHAARSESGSAQTTELQNLLDARLQPEVEPAPFVHAIWGLRFSRLAEIYPEWTTRRAALMFGDRNGIDEKQAEAWRAFLHTRRSDALTETEWTILEDRLTLAVESLGSSVDRDQDPNPPDVVTSDAEIIACDVIERYRDGFLPLRGGLVEQLFAAAPASVRQLALSVVVGETSAETPPAEVKRLTELWEWRSSVVKTRESGQDAAIELVAFFSWMMSDAFEREWTLDHLRDALESSGAWAHVPRGDLRPLSRLATLAKDSRHAAPVLASVSALLKGTFEADRAEEVLIEIVRNARPHEPGEAFAIANVLAHRIGPDVLETCFGTGQAPRSSPNP